MSYHVKKQLFPPAQIPAFVRAFLLVLFTAQPENGYAEQDQQQGRSFTADVLIMEIKCPQSKGDNAAASPHQ